MDAEAYRQFLLNNLQFAKPASGHKEVVCKCYYCDDNGDHHHMYVSVPQNDDQVSQFNCFKCGTHGMVTSSVLSQWGIFDYEYSILITNHNRGVFRNPQNYLYSLSGIFNLSNSFVREAEISEMKRKYINDRLGLDFSYQDIIDNKIVLNINDLLKTNPINKLTRSPVFINELNKSYLGFISYDNGFINMRKVNDQSWIEDRYINYSIFDKQDNTMKFYISPTTVDIADPHPIKVHMAEGPFDILSVKYNLRKEFTQSIYGAVGGNTYKGFMRNLICNLKLINLEIHLYADNDPNPKTYSQNLSIIRDLIQFLRPYKYPIYIHRNTKSKDMGVRIEQINETIEKVN